MLRNYGSGSYPLMVTTSMRPCPRLSKLAHYRLVKNSTKGWETGGKDSHIKPWLGHSRVDSSQYSKWDSYVQTKKLKEVIYLTRVKDEQLKHPNKFSTTPTQQSPTGIASAATISPAVAMGANAKKVFQYKKELIKVPGSIQKNVKCKP